VEDGREYVMILGTKTIIYVRSESMGDMLDGTMAAHDVIKSWTAEMVSG
jgi:hypothetical protein